MKSNLHPRYVSLCSFELLPNVFEFLMKDLEQSQLPFIGECLHLEGCLTAFECLVHISPHVT